MPSLKLAACQAKSFYLYNNLRTEIQRCCSNIYFNRRCLKQGLIPEYAQIKIPYTSPASIITQKKTQVSRLKEEIKFLSKKNDKLNKFLYRTHLQAAQEWGKTWDLISDIIHSTWDWIAPNSSPQLAFQWNSDNTGYIFLTKVDKCTFSKIYITTQKNKLKSTQLKSFLPHFDLTTCRRII